MNLGFSEMLFIFLFALIIFGPKKLPEIGRQIGKALAEFKRASNDFKSQLEAEMRNIEIEEALRKQKEELAQALQPPAGTVTGSGLGASAGAAVQEPAVEPLPSPSILPPAHSDAVKGTDA